MKIGPWTWKESTFTVLVVVLIGVCIWSGPYLASQTGDGDAASLPLVAGSYLIALLVWFVGPYLRKRRDT